MELSEIIASRRSIRKFKGKDVSEETIRILLDAARLAPSGSNLQPWRFVVVRSPEARNSLQAATVFRFALKAPVVIACCSDFSSLEGRPERMLELFQAGVFDNVEVDGEYVPPDRNRDQLGAYLNMNVGIAITHMMLKAVDLGLGTCWIGGFDSVKAKEILGLEDPLQVVALLPIGYPAKVPAARPRFDLGKLIVKTI